VICGITLNRDEQARLRLGQDFSVPRAENCPGITTDAKMEKESHLGIAHSAWTFWTWFLTTHQSR
jgi:hypothetical protein